MKIDIVKNNFRWLGISILIVILSLLAVWKFGLQFGVDFTGGTVLEYKLEGDISTEQLKLDIEKTEGAEVSRIVGSDSSSYLLQMKEIKQEKVTEITDSLIEQGYAGVENTRVETVGPSVGKDLRGKSITSLIVVSLAIMMYLGFAFRKVKKPLSPWTFGVAAIIAALYDGIVVLGAFAVLGYFFGAEIDTLFVTAVLTVLGFSVHDSIVVFDRVRENSIKYGGETLPRIVNFSLVETLGRSINLSVTVIFVLVSLVLLGGTSIRWFASALLIGMVSGTYSSIFVASQVLVVWENIQKKFGRK